MSASGLPDPFSIEEKGGKFLIRYRAQDGFETVMVDDLDRRPLAERLHKLLLAAYRLGTGDAANQLEAILGGPSKAQH